MQIANRRLGSPSRIASKTIWLILTVMTCSAHSARATSPPTQILLLHNGQSLQGQITPTGDHYLVTLPRGEIRIPAEQVAGICNSLDEVYLRRSNAIRFGNAIEHLKLSQWCLDRNLRDRAQQQFDLAVGMQPNHPRVALIQRQLAAVGDARGVAKAPTTYSLPESSDLDLDDLVRKMPEGTTESFTKAIQPVLLNSCSARACHGSAGDNDFRLIKFARGQLPPRRLTLRNLNATIKWIDRQQPLDSPLLRFAVQPHGGKRLAPLASDTTPYARLAEWVGQVVGADAASQKTADMFATSRPAFRASTNADVQGSNTDPTLHNPSPLHEEPTSTGPKSGDLRPHVDIAPKDPFDPEIFNRRYHPTKR